MPLNWDSLMADPEDGLLSGNSARIMVTMSDGLMTRYGRTSVVSRSEVNDLAGKSFGFDLESLDVRNLAMMFSMCVLISGGTAPDCFLGRH
jgi:hypothetical protein